VEDYIGCKITIDHEEGSVKFTQPVLVQSLNDQFEDILQGTNPLTPARPGNILTTCSESDKLSPEMHSRYRTGVGKLLYLAKNSRPDIANAVHELARHCHAPSKAHWDAMTLCIRYVQGTPTRGLVLKPSGKWDGRKGTLSSRFVEVEDQIPIMQLILKVDEASQGQWFISMIRQS
jgi:hypothetical protein